MIINYRPFYSPRDFCGVGRRDPPPPPPPPSSETNAAKEIIS